MSSYPRGPWFWGSWCSFSSPFHPRKYPFVAQIVILLSMLWLMDHLWPSNGHPILLGASDIKWPVSSSRQWWCPTLWEYHPSLCASHPARKFQGYLGNFHELHWKLKKNCPGIPEIFEQGGLRKITDDTLKHWAFSIPGIRTHLLGSTEEAYIHRSTTSMDLTIISAYTHDNASD